MNLNAITMLIIVPVIAIFALNKVSRIIARFFVRYSVRAKYKEALEFERQRQNADIDR